MIKKVLSFYWSWVKEGDKEVPGGAETPSVKGCWGGKAEAYSGGGFREKDFSRLRKPTFQPQGLGDPLLCAHHMGRWPSHL